MKITTRELVVFGLLGGIMFASKIALEFLPNVHILGMLTMAYTVTYRKKALYPIYTYVFLNGLYAGFNMWWLPYLYLWAILWGVTMLLPKKMKPQIAVPVYMVVCALHGFLFGTMYAPAQALIFGLNFKGMVAWIVAGLPYDAIHGVSNFFMGTLVLPMVNILHRADKAAQIPDV